ncbi:hypothetical protein [Rhodobacter ferrooxidans]|uniref:Uncharacterized protein n=1 Tax=Rhodobacter ferrooxidans TaxID=371731 RepID=C8S3J9_9RHOB|nr:hypothetical protein [Rhodobacter sp. SW2]EEW24447.1 conserved hypothetical protein [Rhodobacter sp. SW2]
MKQSSLPIIVVVLVAVIAVLGYYLYQARQQPTGVEIRMDEGGISIQEN